MSSFRATVDAVDSAWLSEVLGCTVNSFEVQYFGEGTGIIGLVTRLHLDAPDGPDTIIAKFPSPAPENRAVAATYDMYGREVNFYQHIAPALNLRTARCFFAAHDPETQDFVLLLEDLTGYKIGDQVVGCSLEEARAVVDFLARLHAGSWNGKGVEALISHNNPMQRDGMIGGFGLGWPVVVEQFRELVPDAALAAGDKMPEAIPRLLDTMTAAPISMCHADVRLDNIFFGDDGEIVMVDWQAVCTSAPEQDLAYFLTQSVPRSVLAQEDLVARYHAALTAHGIDYPLEQCRERFRVSALYLLNFAVVIAGTLDMGNERGQTLARTLLGNSLAALDEMNAFELLE